MCVGPNQHTCPLCQLCIIPCQLHHVVHSSLCLHIHARHSTHSNSSGHWGGEANKESTVGTNNIYMYIHFVPRSATNNSVPDQHHLGFSSFCLTLPNHLMYAYIHAIFLIHTIFSYISSFCLTLPNHLIYASMQFFLYSDVCPLHSCCTYQTSVLHM